MTDTPQSTILLLWQEIPAHLKIYEIPEGSEAGKLALKCHNLYLGGSNLNEEDEDLSALSRLLDNIPVV